MKQFYLLATIILLSISAIAAPVNTAVKNGNWSTSGTWSLNRVPASGDTVVIPVDKIVTLNSSENFSNLFLKVYGDLQLRSILSLSLDDASTIAVYKDGIIDGNLLLTWIGIGNNTVFYGSDISGPMYANASTGSSFLAFNNVTIPGGGTGTILPVKFTALNTTKRTNDILIQWNVAQEVNVNRYEVERSYDGKNWETVASVKATNASGYSYSDKNINSGAIYYHIKEVDNDGSYAFSIIKMLSLQSATTAKEVKILSMQNRVVLQFPQQVKGNVSVRFLASGGQVVGEQILNEPVGQVILNQNSSLRGNYFVSVSNGSSLNTTGQVIL